MTLALFPSPVKADWRMYYRDITIDSINAFKVDTAAWLGGTGDWDELTYGDRYYWASRSLEVVKTRYRSDSIRWVLEPTGEVNVTTKTPTFILKNVRSGYYLKGRGIMTKEKQDACDFVVVEASDTTWVKRSYKTYPFQFDFIHFSYDGDSIYATVLTEDPVKPYGISNESYSYNSFWSYIDSLSRHKVTPEEYCVVGNGIGMVPESEFNNFNDLYKKTKSLDDGLPTESYRQAELRLRQAYAHIDSLVAEIPDGYYYIRRASVTWDKGNIIYWDFWCSEEGVLKVKEIKTDPLGQSLFYFSKDNTTGGYIVRNVCDSMYMGAAKGENVFVPMQRYSGSPQYLRGTKKGLMRMWSTEDTYGKPYGYRTVILDCWHSCVGCFPSSGIPWALLRVENQDSIEAIRKAVEQKWWNQKFDALKKDARSFLMRASICKVDTQNPLVTDVSQLSCNNLDALYDHDLQALLDGDPSTKIYTTMSSEGRYVGDGQTAPEDSAYHYLQVHTDEAIPDSIALWWTIANGNAPTSIALSVSNNGTEWVAIDTLSYPETLFPTDLEVPEYLSQSPIYLPKGTYTYLRMTVLETKSGSRSYAGFPYFSLSGFNVYPILGGLNPTSQVLRPEVKEAANILEKAMVEANKVPEGQTTPDDYARLKQAYDGLSKVWADTTLLQQRIREAHTLVTGSVEGNEIGMVEQGSVNQLKTTLDGVEQFKPFYKLTRIVVDSLTDAMGTALNNFSKRFVLPEEDVWYFFTNKWANSSVGTPTSGVCLWPNDYDATCALVLKGLPKDNEQKGRAAWRFVPMNRDAQTYAIQNLGSGWYLGELTSGRICMSDTAVPYRFVSLGNGKLGLSTTKNSYLLSPISSAQYVQGALQYTDGRQAWTFVQVDEERMTEIKSFLPSSYGIVTVPYGMRLVPRSSDATLTWYTVCGAERDENGIHALKLKEWGDVLEPGVPYIVKIGESEKEKVYVDMCIDLLDVESNLLVTPQNGLHGTLKNLWIKGTKALYIESEEEYQQLISEESDRVQIKAQTGYVVLSEVEDTGEEPDALLVLNESGAVGVRSATKEAASRKTNIYTIDGVLLFRGIENQNQVLRHLSPGLYIVGKEKRLIR